MYGANPFATVPFATASASVTQIRGLVTLTATGQNAVVLSDVRRNGAIISDNNGGQ